jgi:RNA polymerase sigma-70 factor (ECF subfamily)
LHRPSQVAAWLRRCAVNVAITELRRRNTHQQAGAKLAENCSHTVGSEPTDLIAATEEAAQLRHALAALASDQRALLSLRFDEGLTFREIASTVERPVSTVKSQVRTAIERLRTLLIPAHEGGGDDGQR